MIVCKVLLFSCLKRRLQSFASSENLLNAPYIILQTKLLYY